MLFSSLHDLRGGLPKRLTLPAIAFGLVLLYFVSLHPATGFLGGAFFLLLGWWFIPSAINLLLAAWLASLFKVHKTLRAAIFVAASFFFGNEYAAAYFAQIALRGKQFRQHTSRHPNKVR